MGEHFPLPQQHDTANCSFLHMKRQNERDISDQSIQLFVVVNGTCSLLEHLILNGIMIYFPPYPLSSQLVVAPSFHAIRGICHLCGLYQYVDCSFSFMVQSHYYINTDSSPILLFLMHSGKWTEIVNSIVCLSLYNQCPQPTYVFLIFLLLLMMIMYPS